jgi:signal transduction histidine kinase
MTTVPRAPLLVELSAWPGIVLCISRDDAVISTNGRLELLLGEDSIVGRSFSTLLDEESSGRKWTRMSTMHVDDRTTKWELMFRTADAILDPRTFTVTTQAGGTELWLVEHPNDPRLEKLTGRVAMMNSELENTQRVLVKEQTRLAHALVDLRQSNNALDEFAHAVSHDLKAPLRAIIDYAGQLRSIAAPRMDPTERDYLGRLESRALSMRAMIDAVLEYARAGRQTGVAEPLDSELLLRGIVAYLDPPPDVRIDLLPGLPTIDVQRVPFEQVFRNLISNAIKYRRASDAWIRVNASRTETFWEFVVSDNGCGIAPFDQDRIWRLFQSAQGNDGTGIGLAVVKRIVESQGGRVFVQSTLGEGSHFHVLWPRVAALFDSRQS